MESSRERSWSGSFRRETPEEKVSESLVASKRRVAAVVFRSGKAGSPYGAVRKAAAVAITLLLMSAFSMVSHPLAESVDHVVNRLQSTYERVETVKADFLQESIPKALGVAQRFEGKVFFKRGGKMRWNYREPPSQTVVSDGKTVWFYMPEDNQVMITPLDQSVQSGISAGLLTGRIDLMKEFNIILLTSPREQKEGVYRLELVPKTPLPNVSRIELTVDEESLHVRETRLIDLFGNVTHITFKEMSFNPPLSESLFTFTVPEGVDVVTLPTALGP